MDSAHQSFDPPVAIAQKIAPNLRRILAPNPSPMTFRGTNTYLLGSSDLAIIDPGPDQLTQLRAIKAALQGTQKITHILITHSHLDHSPLARRLSADCGAPIFAFGRCDAGQSDRMKALIKSGYSGCGEGVDSEFIPDHILKDGSKLTGPDWELEAIHTPGHFSNHLCFGWQEAAFTGDHIMGWASSMVSPPDGDMGDFIRSCKALLQRNWNVFYPGHGDIVQTPNARIRDLLAHRKHRERSILAALSAEGRSIKEITKSVYHDTSEALLPAAARNVFAHLIDLCERQKAICDDPIRFESQFRSLTP